MIKVLNNLSVYILPVLITSIIVYGIVKKTPVYEDFIEGAKDGLISQ